MRIAIIPSVEMGTVKECNHFWLEKGLKEFDEKNELFFVYEGLDFYSVDYFLFMNFYDFSLEILIKIYELGLENRTIYWMQEPSVVIPFHDKDGVETLKKYFNIFLTWDEDLIDSKRVFKNYFTYNWKQTFSESLKIRQKCFDSDEKKLLTNISGDKHSKGEGELYSARRQVIDYFEKYHSEDFDFYGFGWDKNYINYKGVVKNKIETYSGYKFAICFENVSKNNWVTEKIMDCLIGGAIPIYMGAPNICQFIPNNCFISYEQFDSVEEMYNYLSQMDNEEYQRYKRNILDFLNKLPDIECFSEKKWAELFVIAIESLYQNEDFIVERKYRYDILKRYVIYRLKKPYIIAKKVLRKSIGVVKEKLYTKGKE